MEPVSICEIEELDAKVQLLDVLYQSLSAGLAAEFRTAARALCRDEEALGYILDHTSSFVFHAKEFLFSKILGGDSVTSVRIVFPRNRVTSSTSTTVRVELWSSRHVQKVSGWQEFADNIIRRLLRSLTPNPDVSVTSKAAFQILNRMIGSPPLHAIRFAIEEAIRSSIASHDADAVRREFLERQHGIQVDALRHFIRKSLSQDVLTEKDILSCWHEELVGLLMED